MSYTVKLSSFEGPLDLLLHLISNAKIRIEDIFVSEITEQYLRHMEELDTLDMERASDFLQMAATLLYIKSRSLLPRREEDAAEEGDPEAELIERLRQYRLYKEACEALKGMEKDAKAVFFKLAEEIPIAPVKVSFEGVTLEALCEAYLAAVRRLKIPDEREKEKPLHIAKEYYSVKEKMNHVLREARRNERISFFELFKKARSKMEAAVIFLAVLELLHINEITIHQENMFDDISITCVRKVV